MSDITAAGLLSGEDLATVKEVLIAERDRGVAEPRLPLDVDIDGDGVTDAFGLSADGEVILISGVSLGESMYESEGEDEGFAIYVDPLDAVEIVDGDSDTGDADLEGVSV